MSTSPVTAPGASSGAAGRDAGDRPQWARDAVFYQIFPDRFRRAVPALDPPGTVPWGTPPDREHFQGGDLEGITAGLGHLERLGIGGLYLNPVFAAGTNHRYDTWDYRAVDPHLGDLGALRELVDEAHGRGIRVILDGVFNHCGAGHPAFRSWRADGAASPYSGWFTGWPAQPSGALDYQTCGGADYLPKLDLTDPGARAHVLETATFWIEQAHVDGWRLDVPYKVAHEFWAEFRCVVRSVAPDAFLLGEVWRDAVPWLDVFDGVTHYRQRANILDYWMHDALDGEDFGQEAGELAAAHGAAADWMMNLVGSHDTARVLTVAGGDRARTRGALAAMFTLPGIPLVYYGDEIGLAGGDDPDCRRAMPWDVEAWDTETLETVRALAEVRRRHAALRSGAYRTLLARNGLMAFERRSGDDVVVVVLNPRVAQSHVDIPLPRASTSAATWREALTGTLHAATGDHLLVGEVAGASFAILEPVAA